MAFLEIRTNTALNVIIMIAGLLVSGFLLLFGVANLIDPDVPEAYYARNTKVCLIVSGIGMFFLLLAIAAFRGIILKKKSIREEDK